MKTLLHKSARYVTQHAYTVGIIILCICNVLVRLPFLNLPSVGDEGLYYQGVLTIYKHNLNPFVEFWSYKPPVIFWFTALIFKLFQPSRMIAHLFVYFLSSCTLLLLYLVGKKLRDEKVGFLAALLLCLTPTFIFQSMLFLDSLFISVLLLATIYAYLSKRYFLYFITCSLLVLTKETQIFIPFLIFFYAFFVAWKRHGFSLRHLWSCSFLLLPSIWFLLWIAVNKYIFGWYVWPLSTTLLHSLSIHNVLNRLKELFIHSGIWSIALPTLFTYYFYRVTIIKKNPFTLFFLISYVFYTCLFLIFPPWPRYVLPYYPLLYLLCFICISYSKFARYLWKSFLVFICIMIGSWIMMTVKFPISGSWGEDDLFRIISLDQQTIRFIQETYPNAIILTTGGENNQIYTDPFLGYVTEQSRFSFAAYLSCNTPTSEQKLYMKDDIRTVLTNPTGPVIYIDTSSYTGACTTSPAHLQFLKRIYSNNIDTQSVHDIYLVTQ